VRAVLNPRVRRDDEFRGLFAEEEYRDVHAYYAVHPELPPTPLRRLTSLARSLELAALDVKDESQRFGVNAFKILGVRYAVHRLGDAAARRGLVCATAGNHGRAVARVAKQKGVPCTVFLPQARTGSPLEQRTRAARVAAMRHDGADVVELPVTYEGAVAHAAAFAAQAGGTVVSDTSWDGYDEIPRWIMAGYTQLFEEAASQWDSPPDVVLVQGGVGGLVCAAASWFAWRFGAARPFIIACEPETAACLLESSAAGAPTRITAPLDTIMAGLRCAEPSPAAWPAIDGGVDAFVTVDDEAVLGTLDRLRTLDGEERLDPGPSGACGLAALEALVSGEHLAPVRSAARLGPSTRAFAVVTEGA